MNGDRNFEPDLTAIVYFAQDHDGHCQVLLYSSSEMLLRGQVAIEKAIAADFFWYQRLGEVQGRGEWFGGSQHTVYSQEALRELIRQSGKQLVGSTTHANWSIDYRLMMKRPQFNDTGEHL